MTSGTESRFLISSGGEKKESHSIFIQSAVFGNQTAIHCVLHVARFETELLSYLDLFKKMLTGSFSSCIASTESVTLMKFQTLDIPLFVWAQYCDYSTE